MLEAILQEDIGAVLKRVPLKDCSYYKEQAFLLRFLFVPLDHKEPDKKPKETGRGMIRNAKRNQEEQ